MRIVSSKPNTLRLQDNISDSVLELYYATPTAAQQAAYTNGMYTRKRNKVINTTGECRQKFGRQILAGFREGDFAQEVNGQAVAVSSSQGTDGYRKDWKEWFCKYNADLVERLAIHAFEQSTSADDGLDTDSDDEEIPEDDADQDAAGDDTDPN